MIDESHETMLLFSRPHGRHYYDEYDTAEPANNDICDYAI